MVKKNAKIKFFYARPLCKKEAQSQPRKRLGADSGSKRKMRY